MAKKKTTPPTPKYKYIGPPSWRIIVGPSARIRLPLSDAAIAKLISVSAEWLRYFEEITPEDEPPQE